MLDQRCALALNVARQQLLRLSLAEFKILVRNQFFVLQLDPERALAVLPSLVLERDARKELLSQASLIVSAGDPPAAAERECLAHLAALLGLPVEKPAASDRHASAVAAATMQVVKQPRRDIVRDQVSGRTSSDASGPPLEHKPVLTKLP
jgi:hypothetical protein